MTVESAKMKMKPLFIFKSQMSKWVTLSVLYKSHCIVVMSKSEDILVQERDLKFKQWLQNKAIKEKTFEVRYNYTVMYVSDDTCVCVCVCGERDWER